MKTLTLALMLFFSVTGFATEHCSLKLKISGSSYLSTKQLKKIENLLKEKGYLLTKSSEAKYMLSLTRYYGWDCGTGLSNWDATFNVPSGYRISFQGPFVSLEKQEDFQGLIGLVDRKSFRKAMSEIRSTNDCQ